MSVRGSVPSGILLLLANGIQYDLCLLAMGLATILVMFDQCQSLLHPTQSMWDNLHDVLVNMMGGTQLFSGNNQVDHLSHVYIWSMVDFNPLRAKFFRGNINIYLHFVSFLHIGTTQVVEILTQIRQEPTYST